MRKNLVLLAVAAAHADRRSDQVQEGDPPLRVRPRARTSSPDGTRPRNPWAAKPR